MTYVQPFTLIDELPPMIQLSAHKTVNMDPRNMSSDSVYYEEIVKDYPNIQSKIRKTDPNPFGKYDETMMDAPKVVYHQELSADYETIQQTHFQNMYPYQQQSPLGQQYLVYQQYPDLNMQRHPPPQQSNQYPFQYPDPNMRRYPPPQPQQYPPQQYPSNQYPIPTPTSMPQRSPMERPKPKGPENINYNKKESQPSVFHNDYVPGSMVPEQRDQHLPISQSRNIHYNKPMLDGDQYPVVENYDISCKDVMHHIDNCPVCSKLYKRNDRIYIGIIAVLILLIFILVWKKR